MATQSPPHKLPKTITGGCLCGSVRYQIEFSPSHDWKRGPHTCQCTQCRKNNGSLIYNFHTVTASEITWLSQKSFTEYQSSPACYRAFCNACGSPLAWRQEDASHSDPEWEMAVGTIDAEFLKSEKEGGFAEALTTLSGDHFYVKDEIAGITDVVSGGGKGTRFWEGSKGGAMKEGEEEKTR